VDDAYAEAVSIENDNATRRVDAAGLERLIRHVVEAEGGELVHLSVVLAGHDTVRHLNETYLGHEHNTDVLSFSLRDGSRADTSVVEGEVYVDLDTAAERHADFDASFEKEARRYVVHGLLHLLGYDDATPSGQKTMRKLEDEYLDSVQSA